ncbi:polysaccharide pyruvyl transferase family protein [Paenibacillus filicis]|uniref:Polysaccharide pyruvyl transferase family protein n=1 Tax=Paenibacillus filicis TaxID=669464 RepID=A0ABU9DDH3_9BACL
MSKQTRVIIINGYGTMNRGDHALLSLSIDHARKAFGTDSDVTASVLYPQDEDPSFFGAKEVVPHILGGINSSGVKRRFLLILNVLWFLIVLFTLKEIPFLGKERTFRAVKKADVVLSCAGGYLNDASTGFIAACAEILLALRLKKKVILLPQSIGPFRTNFRKYLVAKLLNNVHLVVARDQPSVETCLQDLKMHGNNIIEIPDLMFGDLPELKKNVFKKNKLGITVINWEWPGVNREENQKRYIMEIANFIDCVKDKYEIFLFEQVKEQRGVPGDTTAIRQLSEILNKKNITINFVPSDISLKAYIEEIRSCEFFIASRLHSGLFAIVGNVPTITIAYQPKTVGAMKLLGLEQYSVNIEVVTAEVLWKKLEVLQENRHEIIEVSQQKIELIQKELNQLPFRIKEKVEIK